MHTITESHVEIICLDYLEKLGYGIISGLDISPDGLFQEREYSEVILARRLRDAVDRLNPYIPFEAKEEAVKKVLRVSTNHLVLDNEVFHRYMTEGVQVEFRTRDEIRGDSVHLIDYDNPENNEFLAVNQFTVIENNINKRPDIVVFVNGLPLVVIELKNPIDIGATVKTAFNQLQTYKQVIPSVFTYNSLLIASDGWDARVGTITSDWARFLPWKTHDGRTTSDTSTPQVEVMFKGMLNKGTFLDLIRHFIVFESAKEKTLKKVAAYHQYYAVNKAVKTTSDAIGLDGDKRAGVIWHTQGSGKSLSMVFYTGKLVLALDNPTIVVLTDRNDLDDQLYDTFYGCRQLLRQEPVQAEDRKHLRQILNVASGGIVFTTIQKFMPILDKDELAEPGVEEPNPDLYFVQNKPLSLRRNIVVIADEAHRSQYDFIDGFAKHLRDALPNASFIGFTGTPIEVTDRNTQAVFGDYIDVYDIQQAVRDGATVSIYYEGRLAKVNFNEDEKVTLDEEFEELTESQEVTEKQKMSSKWSKVEAIVGNERRIKKIAEDLVKHFEARNAVSDGKGMIVCMSRRICVDMYNAIVSLRPQWHNDDDTRGTIKVIMTGSSSDPVLWQQHIRNKIRRKAIGDRMRNSVDDLKLVIVRDMWLTGFDAPSLHTMYIDKPMRGHNLMQAIARVNRVFKDKAGGLVVDYLGIAQDLKKALHDYTSSGGEGTPTFDQEEAVANMLEIYETVVQMFGSYEEKFRFLPEAANYIFSLEIEILDDKFLAEIMNMTRKNLAAELLKRLLKDEIKNRLRLNLTEGKKFSERLEEAIQKYHNGMVDTVTFIEQFLIPMAKEMREADRRGEIMHMDFRELAFYDALETNDSAVAVLGDDTLRTIARELLQSVRKSTTIDWTIKESVQATLRRNIRRILRKYGYPPDKQEKAVQTVIEQAKLLAEELA